MTTELSPFKTVNEIKKLLNAYGIYIRMDDPVDVWAAKILECMDMMGEQIYEYNAILEALVIEGVIDIGYEEEE